MDTDTGRWIPVTTTREPEAEITGLIPGKEYKFRVKAVNPEGESEPLQISTGTVAKNPFVAPHIDRTNLNNLVIKAGNVVKLDADVKGEPPPKITWAFNGEPIVSGERIKIDNKEYHIFILTKAQRSDTGKYIVTAVNDAGKDEVEVEITVLGNPSKPKGPLEVSDVHAEGCKLKWDKPEDDGGSPIKEYVVEKMDTDTGRWIPVTTTREPDAEITGLIPGKEYKFRVKAVNPEGESEPLETSTGTVAKNPFEEPGKPGKPFGHHWGKRYVDLIWTLPASDGGAPITSYIIEKKDKICTNWRRASEAIGGKCEARVSDLIEGMEYNFRVRAVNKAGQSKPSDSSSPVIAKPTFLDSIPNWRWIPVTTTREPEAEITGLIPGKEYKFRVKAVNPEGESEPLETSTGTVTKNPFDPRMMGDHDLRPPFIDHDMQPPPMMVGDKDMRHPPMADQDFRPLNAPPGKPDPRPFSDPWHRHGPDPEMHPNRGEPPFDKPGPRPGLPADARPGFDGRGVGMSPCLDDPRGANVPPASNILPWRMPPVSMNWLLDNYEMADGMSVPKSSMYIHYLKHCSDQKMKPLNTGNFGKLIRAAFTGLRTRRLGTKGNSKYHYCGICLKASSSVKSLGDLVNTTYTNSPYIHRLKSDQNIKSINNENCSEKKYLHSNEEDRKRSPLNQSKSHQIILGDASTAIPNVDINVSSTLPQNFSLEKNNLFETAYGALGEIMDSADQNPDHDDQEDQIMKKCFVSIQKLNIIMDDYDSDSSIDLPPLEYLSSSSTKTKRKSEKDPQDGTSSESAVESPQVSRSVSVTYSNHASTEHIVESEQMGYIYAVDNQGFSVEPRVTSQSGLCSSAGLGGVSLAVASSSVGPQTYQHASSSGATMHHIPSSSTHALRPHLPASTSNQFVRPAPAATQAPVTYSNHASTEHIVESEQMGYVYAVNNQGFSVEPRVTSQSGLCSSASLGGVSLAVASSSVGPQTYQHASSSGATIHHIPSSSTHALRPHLSASTSNQFVSPASATKQAPVTYSNHASTEHIVESEQMGYIYAVDNQGYSVEPRVTSQSGLCSSAGLGGVSLAVASSSVGPQTYQYASSSGATIHHIPSSSTHVLHPHLPASTSNQFVSPAPATKQAPPTPVTAGQRTVGVGIQPAATGQLVVSQGQSGVFSGPQGTILLNQIIPGVEQSPILIQGNLNNLTNHQGLQLTLRPPNSASPGHSLNSNNPGHAIAVPHLPVAPTLQIATIGNTELAPVTLPMHGVMAAGQGVISELSLQSHAASLALQTPQQSLFGATVPFTSHIEQPSQHLIQVLPLQPSQIPTNHTVNQINNQPQSVEYSPKAPSPLKTSKGPSVSLNFEDILKETGIVPENSPPLSPDISVIEEIVPAQLQPTNTGVPPQQLTAASLQGQVVIEQVSQKLQSQNSVSQMKLPLAQDGSAILQPQNSFGIHSQFQYVQAPQCQWRAVSNANSIIIPAITTIPSVTTSESSIVRSHSNVVARLNIPPPVSVPDISCLGVTSIGVAITSITNSLTTITVTTVANTVPLTVQSVNVNSLPITSTGYIIQRTTNVPERTFFTEDINNSQNQVNVSSEMFDTTQSIQRTNNVNTSFQSFVSADSVKSSMQTTLKMVQSMPIVSTTNCVSEVQPEVKVEPNHNVAENNGGAVPTRNLSSYQHVPSQIMDSADQDPDHDDLDTKKCFVNAQKLNIDMDDYDSDSSIDLPPLTYLSSVSTKPKRKSEKTTAELLKEHQNLANNLKIDCASNINIDETLKRLEVIHIETIENEDSLPESPVSPPTQYQDQSFHVFLVHDTLQFFNSRDVTPSKCGFENILNSSIPITEYEKEMLSFKRVEFEYVISSFLFSSNTFCISDLKAFTTYLLRNLSIHVDVACLAACYDALISLLDQHPDAKNLSFNSAEIFMILFNYGTDIDSFLFLREWPDVSESLEQSHERKKNYKEIPGRWTVNFKYVLKAIMNVISTCKLKTKDLIKTIVYFLWMTLDSTLHTENLYSYVRECIFVALEQVPEEKWNKVLGVVSKTLLSLEFSSKPEKWSSLSRMVESIPNNCEKGVQLRRLISFSALKCLCLQIYDLDVPFFDIYEFHCILEQLSDVDSSLLCVAIKFVDICVKDLNATKEDYKDLLNVLKQCEANISENAHDAKAHLMKIHAKLKIFSGGNVYKIMHSADQDPDHDDLDTKKCLVSKQKLNIDMDDYDRDSSIDLPPLPYLSSLSTKPKRKSEKIMDSADQDPDHDDLVTKKCFVSIQKLNININDYDRDSSIDLPPLPYLSSLSTEPKRKSEKIMDSADQDPNHDDLDTKKCLVSEQKLNIDMDDYDRDSSIDLPPLPYLSSLSSTPKRKSEMIMNSADQDPDHDDLVTKKCFVSIQKLNININDYNRDSSIDLPPLPYLSSLSTEPKRKSEKTTAELLKEHQNLENNLKVDCASNINIDETLKRLEVIQIETIENEDSLPGSPVSPPTQYQEQNFHVFLVHDTLQFFNSRDVTPSKCGFENILNSSIPITEYEKEMLSFKRVEFEHVISSFLFSSNTFCISDLKSFTTYLLRNLSIHVDVACLGACYDALISLLDQHPDAKNLSFNSAEIFMILFNYGTDIDSFLFLREWPDVLESLEQSHEKKNFKEIPGRWTVNFKYVLKAIMEVISTCKFKTKDLIKTIVYFLWMTLDSTLHKENLYSYIRECVFVALEQVPEEKWNKVLGVVSKTLLSLEFSSKPEKWSNLSHMVESIPNNCGRGVQLRRLISFSALKCLCLQIYDLDVLAFDIYEFHRILEQLSDVDSSLLCVAIKFVDICVKHLNATKEAKTHLMKIHAKLKIFSGGNVCKIHLFQHKEVYKKDAVTKSEMK